ncbi:uncharacterized protein LOC114276645 [Camellia sinensis]|uniref:uncharacterized protein LOC114276645 n=1 Tax=Camellia sinensis TaxID=4442 RepID=UPI0010356DA7|nr:uncharacterized protein LOC114276645 [Camellia sinensis]
MSLKKEWQAWTKLMDSSKGVSGIGFDCDTGMFQAPREWWDKMESINKVCAKFRKKTLEHRELMETFMGASTTGQHHWTPGEKLHEAANDSSDSVHSLGAQPFADPRPVGVQDVDSDSSLEHVPIEKGKRRKTPSTSVSKSKKATSGASVIAKNMNNLTDVVRMKNQQVTVRHLTDMHCLTSIPSLIGTPLVHFASTLMGNADYWEVMMCQPDDDHIIGWLTQKQLQCIASAPFANLFRIKEDVMNPWDGSNNDDLREMLNQMAVQDCIGAIDGTHVSAWVTGPEAATYFGRKYYHMQNIMAAVDFDMCFIFISCRWEGSMHDSRIFNEILTNDNVPFPHSDEGKYYLVDSGYPNWIGYLAPFRGSR